MPLLSTRVFPLLRTIVPLISTLEEKAIIDLKGLLMLLKPETTRGTIPGIKHQ